MGTQRGLHSQVIVLALVPCIVCAGCGYPGVVRFSAVESGQVVLDDAGRQAVFPKTGLRLSLVQNRVTGNPEAPCPFGVLVVALENRGRHALKLSPSSVLILDKRAKGLPTDEDWPLVLRPSEFPGSEITLGPNERQELRFGLIATLPRFMFITYWQNGMLNEAVLGLRIQGIGLDSDVVYYGG